ncbi:MAG: hypothetical protein KJ970_14810 [Candidatus Eisenbacteria bacterium]|uniref:histidine kinase n=1 Tax=Eiseniibacteriota bacterium TaxID=2212470 RepID=A0A948RWL2_UNCEI|nr:hypothetical protein [Candidatus Eisenbacteria bacterium]
MQHDKWARPQRVADELPPNGGQVSESLLRHVTQQWDESRRAAAVLGKLLECITSAVFILDAGGRIRYLSAGAETLFHLTASEAAARPIESILGDGTIFTVPKGRSQIELRGRFFQCLMIPLDDRGDCGGAAGALVTQDRLVELENEVSLLRPLAEIGRLLATVLHELRNPLAAIQGTVSLLEQRESHGIEGHLERIFHATKIIQRMVDDILVLARPVQPVMRAFSAAPYLSEILRSFDGPSLSGIKKELRIEEGLPQVWGDSDLMTQILGNCIRNAIEAMGEQGELTLQATRLSSDRVRFLVRDTGPGLDPATASRIFQPFQTGKPGGTGLGLPTARRLAEAMNGTLDVVASPHRGAVFVLELPAHSGEVV